MNALTIIFLIYLAFFVSGCQKPMESNLSQDPSAEFSNEASNTTQIPYYLDNIDSSNSMTHDSLDVTTSELVKLRLTDTNEHLWKPYGDDSLVVFTPPHANAVVWIPQCINKNDPNNMYRNGCAFNDDKKSDFDGINYGQTYSLRVSFKDDLISPIHFSDGWPAGLRIQLDVSVSEFPGDFDSVSTKCKSLPERIPGKGYSGHGIVLLNENFNTNKVNPKMREVIERSYCKVSSNKLYYLNIRPAQKVEENKECGVSKLCRAAPSIGGTYKNNEAVNMLFN